MTDIVKGMCRAYYDEGSDSGEAAMRAALQWLADNVSDEMLEAAEKAAREHKRGMRVNDTKCDQRDMLAKQCPEVARCQSRKTRGGRNTPCNVTKSDYIDIHNAAGLAHRER